jgi:hypothetical protein
MDYKRIRPVRRNLWVGEPGSRPNLIMDSVPDERTNRQVPTDSPKVRFEEVCTLLKSASPLNSANAVSG